MHLRPSRFDARVHALARHRRISPDRGGSRLHAKPLNAVIGRVFGLYRPGRTAGSNAKKKRRKSTILAGRFAGPVGAPVRNQAHRPTEGVKGY
jgi:hypothetical protein